MLLNGDVDRTVPPSDLQECSFALPFIRDVDCALGIAVKHYLDELSATPDPSTSEAHDEVRQKGYKMWFPHAVDYGQSLQEAFALWDVVYAAVKAAPQDLVSKNAKDEWAQVDTWLEQRR